MIAGVVDHKLRAWVIKRAMVELVEEPIALDDRILQFNAFNSLHRMGENRAERDTTAQPDDEDVVASRRQEQRNLAKKRLRRQIVQGIARTVFGDWIESRRGGCVRFAIDQQAGHLGITENGNRAGEALFKHENLAGNPLRAFPKRLAGEARIIPNVAEDT